MHFGFPVIIAPMGSRSGSCDGPALLHDAGSHITILRQLPCSRHVLYKVLDSRPDLDFCTTSLYTFHPFCAHRGSMFVFGKCSACCDTVSPSRSCFFAPSLGAEELANAQSSGTSLTLIMAQHRLRTALALQSSSHILSNDNACACV